MNSKPFRAQMFEITKCIVNSGTTTKQNVLLIIKVLLHKLRTTLNSLWVVCFPNPPIKARAGATCGSVVEYLLGTRCLKPWRTGSQYQ